ncbi:sn-glycerol-3-phosphate ABC transporter ATP-binding protein UgpC [Lachnoclostridium pacaense]|uniref:ABC transporter ATP-binding protein n=1 Tax=Enterocloster hominis (ex Hitch et al. 2024) TaxID=1917870 RepID=UPI001D1154A5|nr:sn-glycerol-3-phosphate ABC transporter ATP-binding protein UgpC [Lachnoclostridium pacaense]MCC2817323.1 sn-glycerol-3-phosphate ABC transporter ATP-binding protein UgpC [Lachnoclostridium pacaense]
MSDISLVNVSKTYKNGYCAVKDFNLDIREGELVIFVGPSGCGKSTTLRMIAGLEDISSGELWMDDCLMNMVEPKDRDLSMVFQNYALYPHMTVYENMAFGLRAHKTPKAEIDKRVREAAGILEIGHLLDRKPSALSGGQKQRVAIGSVIVRKPRAYLMDEPLSNLDAKLRSQMRVEIAKLHRQLGATMIYVTHDQVEAMTLGTRIVVMKDGAIQQVAPPAELYQNPVNRFVAGFIGSPAMNFLEGKVILKDQKPCLEGKGWQLPLTAAQGKKLMNKGYMEKAVTLGIRAEDLHGQASGDAWLEVQVDVREMLGAEVLLHGRVCGDSGSVRDGMDQDGTVRGDTVQCGADRDDAAKSGLARDDAAQGGPVPEGTVWKDSPIISAKLPPSCPAKAGSRVRLYVDMARIKLFDTITEENILYV